MFVLNAYFRRELRFVAILRSKLRFLLRNTGVDSDFAQKKLAAEVSVGEAFFFFKNVSEQIVSAAFLCFTNAVDFTTFYAE